MQRSTLALLVALVAAIAVGVYFSPASPQKETSVGTESRGDDRNRRLYSVDAAEPGQRQTVEVDSRCRQRDPDERSHADVDALYESMAKRANVLRHSSDANHLITVALITGWKKPQSQLELLEKAALSDPRNPLVPWNQLDACRQHNSLECDFDEIESRLIDVDGDNGAVWMQLAGMRLRNGDAAAAAPYFDRAITAPRFDTYFLAHTLALEQGLAAIGDQSYRERVFEAIGISAALAIPYADITTHCAELDASAGQWQKRCDQLGMRMYSESNTVIDMSVGTALRKIAARYENNPEHLAAVARERADLLERFYDRIGDSRANALLENDEKVLKGYIDQFSARGEVAAMQFLHDEVQRLGQLPEYNQCNFVPRWVGE